jgi:hypothetical protein
MPNAAVVAPSPSRATRNGKSRPDQRVWRVPAIRSSISAIDFTERRGPRSRPGSGRQTYREVLRARALPAGTARTNNPRSSIFSFVLGHIHQPPFSCMQSGCAAPRLFCRPDGDAIEPVRQSPALADRRRPTSQNQKGRLKGILRVMRAREHPPTDTQNHYRVNIARS